MEIVFTIMLSCLTFATMIVMFGSVVAIALWLLKTAGQIATWFFEQR
jgi:hypothetical protein